MTATAVLGIDVGGTTVKARLVDGDSVVLGEWRRATPIDDPAAERTVDLIAELFETATAISPVAAVGVAVPGLVDEVAGIALHAVNLGWRDLPLRDILNRRLPVPVAFDHDVRTGALAESISGTGATTPGTTIFVPIGTGISAALVIDGVVVPFAEWDGEIGQELVLGGTHAGRRLEEVASAAGIARLARQPDARAVAHLVRAGDAAAIAVWTGAVEVLADSLSRLSRAVSPSLIVIGGGLAEADALLLDPLGARLAELLAPGAAPRVERATHGDAAASIGATYLARRMLATVPPL